MQMSMRLTNVTTESERHFFFICIENGQWLLLQITAIDWLTFIATKLSKRYGVWFSRTVLWMVELCGKWHVSFTFRPANSHISFNTGKFYPKTCDYSPNGILAMKYRNRVFSFNRLRLRHFEVFAAQNDQIFHKRKIGKLSEIVENEKLSRPRNEISRD